MVNSNESVVQPDPGDVQSNKGMAVLAYIIFFIPLLAAKDSRFAMYHANQGLVLFLGAVASNIVLGMIPIIGWILLPFANLAILVFAIIGIINAANGRNKPLPLIGGINILR
ncbi:hypothetical protein [Paenibacillus sp. GP183]|jgi:uncharacterized membrane protein|uniref:DUF4870 domain-containing protein n=1 Tax=Paenibacillus sp. GP183 TaxID=1882751 RepID=UPI000897AECF|nr:hypothetical protein [Paenibacillus sp. GP183]SEC47105.1 Uncharacterized membrane protein [Paenibacillus sp. GP183]